MLQRALSAGNATFTTSELDADVLVLGAGISGLACAAALRNAGLRVIVLEARDRIGGRLHTVALHGGPGSPNYAVDLGGAWVHGIGAPNGAPNELYKVACDLKLTCRPTDYNDAAVYTADGIRLDERSVADIENLYHVFEQHLQSLLHAPDPRLALMPIQAALEAFAASRGLSPAQSAHLTFAVSNHMEHYWAGEASCMGVAALDEEVLPGGDVVLAEGYGSIVRRLAAGLEQEGCVRLGHEVLAVQYGGGGEYGGAGVVVTARVAPLAAGGVGGAMTAVRQLTARAAVVTLPLGVLRSGAVCFDPPLEVVDGAKAAAIGRLGVALYNKVVMVFRESDVFWDDTAFIYRMPAPAERGRWSYFLNLHKVTGAPILVAFNLGEAAAELENASDAATLDSALTALAGMYGTARVRRPVHTVVTRWGSDPYSRMSYTFIPAGLTSAAFDDLARPVGRSLFFAGEATHRRHYGTAHGAYDSGRLAAAGVMRELMTPLPLVMKGGSGGGWGNLLSPLQRAGGGLPAWNISTGVAGMGFGGAVVPSGFPTAAPATTPATAAAATKAAATAVAGPPPPQPLAPPRPPSHRTQHGSPASSPPHPHPAAMGASAPAPAQAWAMLQPAASRAGRTTPRQTPSTSSTLWRSRSLVQHYLATNASAAAGVPGAAASGAAATAAAAAAAAATRSPSGLLAALPAGSSPLAGQPTASLTRALTGARVGCSSQPTQQQEGEVRGSKEGRGVVMVVVEPERRPNSGLAASGACKL